MLLEVLVGLPTAALLQRCSPTDLEERCVIFQRKAMFFKGLFVREAFLGRMPQAAPGPAPIEMGQVHPPERPVLRAFSVATIATSSNIGGWYETLANKK